MLGIVLDIIVALFGGTGLFLGLSIDGRSWKFPAINRVVNVCIGVALIALLCAMTYYGVWEGAD